MGWKAVLQEWGELLPCMENYVWLLGRKEACGDWCVDGKWWWLEAIVREERVVKKKKERMHEGSWPRDRKQFKRNWMLPIPRVLFCWSSWNDAARWFLMDSKKWCYDHMRLVGAGLWDWKLCYGLHGWWSLWTKWRRYFLTSLMHGQVDVVKVDCNSFSRRGEEELALSMCGRFSVRRRRMWLFSWLLAQRETISLMWVGCRFKIVIALGMVNHLSSMCLDVWSQSVCGSYPESCIWIPCSMLVYKALFLTESFLILEEFRLQVVFQSSVEGEGCFCLLSLVMRCMKFFSMVFILKLYFLWCMVMFGLCYCVWWMKNGHMYFSQMEKTFLSFSTNKRWGFFELVLEIHSLFLFFSITGGELTYAVKDKWKLKGYSSKESLICVYCRRVVLKSSVTSLHLISRTKNGVQKHVSWKEMILLRWCSETHQ